MYFANASREKLASEISIVNLQFLTKQNSLNIVSNSAAITRIHKSRIIIYRAEVRLKYLFYRV